MKKIGLFIFGILALFSSFSFAGTVDPMNLPKFEHFVNDYSNALPEKQRLELGELAKAIEQNSGYQIVTLLFPNRNGNELFDIALKAFNENGIGDEERNDGLLLAIATEEKKIRIIVGYGLESQIPDVLASRIIEEQIRPEVNKGDFYQAVKNFYETLPEYLENQTFERENDSSNFLRILAQRISVIASFIIFFMLSEILFSKEKRKQLKKRYKGKKIIKARETYSIWGMFIGFLGVLISAHLQSYTRGTNLCYMFWILMIICIGSIVNYVTIFGDSKKGGSDGNSSSDRSNSDSDRGSSSSSSDSFSGGGGSSGGGGAGD